VCRGNKLFPQTSCASSGNRGRVIPGQAVVDCGWRGRRGAAGLAWPALGFGLGVGRRGLRGWRPVRCLPNRREVAAGSELCPLCDHQLKERTGWAGLRPCPFPT